MWITTCSTFCFSCQYSPHLYPNIFSNMVIIRRDTPLLDINDVESANFLQDLSASWNFYLFLFFLEILQYCCPFAYYCVSLQSNVQSVIIILGNGSMECTVLTLFKPPRRVLAILDTLTNDRFDRLFYRWAAISFGNLLED